MCHAAGRAATLRPAVEAVRPGGEVLWPGTVPVDAEVGLHWGSLMGEKRIVRSSDGDARPRRDFPWLTREYLRGRLNPDDLIPRRTTPGEFSEGVAALPRGEGILT